MVILKLKNVNFTATKNPFVLDVGIDNILISNKVSFGKKSFEYFIGDKYDDKKVMAIFIMILKMSGYTRSFDETKYMSLLIKDA